MNSSVRTDLAIENAEMFQETEELQGIRIEEETGQVSGIRVTWVTVENEQGAKKLGKAIGDYVTLEVPMLDATDVYKRQDRNQSYTNTGWSGYEGDVGN